MEDLTLLTIDRLNVWYSPGKNVLDNFSLELGDHEWSLATMKSLV